MAGERLLMPVRMRGQRLAASLQQLRAAGCAALRARAARVQIGSNVNRKKPVLSKLLNFVQLYYILQLYM